MSSGWRIWRKIKSVFYIYIYRVFTPYRLSADLILPGLFKFFVVPSTASLFGCGNPLSEESRNTFVSLQELAQLTAFHDLLANQLTLIQGFGWYEFHLLSDQPKNEVCRRVALSVRQQCFSIILCGSTRRHHYCKHYWHNPLHRVIC